MEYKERVKAVLLLADGTSFEGYAIGKTGITTGEICFNTGMTGYQETFTDPSYFGQILVQTSSHIGNYGVENSETESDRINIAGLVCKKFTEKEYSRVRGEQSLQDYFEKHNLVGISDIDTRSLVRHIRNSGAMNAIISSEVTDVEELKLILDRVPSMDGLELSSKVSTKEVFEFGDSSSDLKVAVLDLGVKKNILRCLADRGCFLKVFPKDSSFDEIKAWSPDGIMLSNGPGDPSVMPNVIETVKLISESDIPTFGICLGHQVLALANGLSTKKMHNGHRGLNHPVQNLATGRCEVTSQNHGFVVDFESVKNNPNIELTHVHLNDNTVAGIKVKNKKVFSVQYHPEASAGPHDSRYLFDEFISNIIENKSVLA